MKSVPGHLNSAVWAQRLLSDCHWAWWARPGCHLGNSLSWCLNRLSLLCKKHRSTISSPSYLYRARLGLAFSVRSTGIHSFHCRTAHDRPEALLYVLIKLITHGFTALQGMISASIAFAMATPITQASLNHHSSRSWCHFLSRIHYKACKWWHQSLNSTVK